LGADAGALLAADEVGAAVGALVVGGALGLGGLLLAGAADADEALGAVLVGGALGLGGLLLAGAVEADEALGAVLVGGALDAVVVLVLVVVLVVAAGEGAERRSESEGEHVGELPNLHRQILRGGPDRGPARRTEEGIGCPQPGPRTSRKDARSGVRPADWQIAG